MNDEMLKSKVNVPWIVGGNIPAQDVDALEKNGAQKAFATGTQIETVIEYFKSIKN